MNLNKIDAYEYGIANTNELKEGIFKLREEVYSIKQSYLLNHNSKNPGADRFDQNSYLFYIKHENSIIGSCRLTPFYNNEWEFSEILPNNVLNLDPIKYICFSRVVVNIKYRNNNIHELLFYYFSKWLIDNTIHESFFSLCHPPLLKLYSKYNIIKCNPNPIKIPCRENREYFLIEGNIKSTYNKIFQLINKTNYGNSVNRN